MTTIYYIMFTLNISDPYARKIDIFHLSKFCVKCRIVIECRIYLKVFRKIFGKYY